VKFLVDAQLPLRLARHLTDIGHDAIHSSQLPQGNRTTEEALGNNSFVELSSTAVIVHGGASRSRDLPTAKP
jgi:predicted nuclease of predicted toxin-antitoxin system